jgi:uroporphyrinogen decarboxylase
MTSRERVLATFAHQEPDRVPAWCGASPEFVGKAIRELGLAGAEDLSLRFGDDFRRVFGRLENPEAPRLPGATSRTVFGVDRHGFAYGMPMTHPLAGATLREVHAYPWPDPADVKVEHIRAEALAWKRQYAILGGDWSPFWHDAIDLFGMEGLLLAMHDEPQLVDALFAHLVDYYFAVSCRIFEAGAGVIDIFFIGNDFGSQHTPLIGPAAFRRFLLPHLRRLIRLGHDYRLKVMLHCCGNYAPLIPDLIDAGLDALQAVQPCGRGMEPERLKAGFGSRMVFAGCIDSHHVLIKGTPELVKATTRRILDIMMPGGGYVLSASHDYLLEETPLENVLAMYGTARDYGRID